jgi:ribosomal protein L12E/L44/L45/RPP1/RPP2
MIYVLQKHLILLFLFIAYAAVGCEIDNEKMELLLSQLSGKDITELIAAGREKFTSVPCGGGGATVAAAAPAAGGTAPAAEAKKEEKVEEKEESDDVSLLFLLPIPISFATFLLPLTMKTSCCSVFGLFNNLMPSHLNVIWLCQFFGIIFVPSC